MKGKQLILVVDDVTVNRRILTRILKADGFDTVEADNGKAALEILQSGSKPIALILLDITMPVMNGYELLEKMNSLGLLPIIPVIVTTGSDDENAEVRSLECGATDFLVKPYKPDIVCHRVRSILRLCDNAALIGKLEIDRLTGLYSREFFYRHAQEILDANPNEKYDVLCSNIVNFKIINAKYGIHIGDELLKSIAKHDMECVGETGVCGRIGADTFVALRRRIPPRSQEEIGKQHAQNYKNAPIKNFVMQYGLYPVDDRSMPISDMCDCAQLALATIKHKYGVYYAVYDDSMRQSFLREHQLSEHLEQALAEKQFVVYLQPKHDTNTACIAGAEALVRWVHPELGFISPGEFIPLFERTGFISKLDRYVWEEVCIVLSRWIKEDKPLIPISVNASRADFDESDLIEFISGLTEKYGIPPELLHIEVTESAYTDNPKKIISAITTLRDMGFLIEMDDFGSGYSSLNMLSELPIDMLKLDMRFVQKGNDLAQTNNRSILGFIVSLSKWLQLPTIAEGVETEEDMELLKSMGCNYIQGYYFAKPMPIADFEAYMDKCMSKAPAESSAKHKTRRAPDDESQNGKPLVLVAEDIEGNRELLIDMLSDDYRVLSACNGQEAHEEIAKHRGELSCVLLDLLMPVMEGFQLIDLMKSEGTLEEIPVIITSEAGRDGELRAIHLGADGFVSKPYNAEVVEYYVRKAVNEREYRRIKKASHKG
ncbi:MAG: EAL domain-containing protein [Eubacteriales bacterium]|nr:EAL domain-containing protein [Eubacteriales bacterium]MDD3882157.1 EAL domain-containing protein [Eubacteriales bacterium]MDD4513262.1 EAL domain-containing protein [Eubacteriales bacterium]